MITYKVTYLSPSGRISRHLSRGIDRLGRVEGPRNHTHDEVEEEVPHVSSSIPTSSSTPASSEWMVKREELSMFVEQRILATLRQPNEHQRHLAYWAWELPVNTPATEYPICQIVMQGVLVPNIHFEVCLCSSVVCPYPFLPSMDQIINQRLHVHTHIISWVFRNYQRQEYVLSLKEDARGE